MDDASGLMTGWRDKAFRALSPDNQLADDNSVHGPLKFANAFVSPLEHQLF